MLESIVDLVSSSPWTYALVLAIAALDAVLPIVPSETTAIAAGVLAATGELNIAFVIGAAAAGAFAGDNMSYVAGRTLGERLPAGPRTRRARAWAESALERRGGYLVVVGRFVPGGRTAVTLTAGLSRMAATRFAPLAGLAAMLWASYAGLLGYVGGRAFEEQPLKALVVAFVLAGVLTLAVEVVRRTRRERRVRRAAPDACG